MPGLDSKLVRMSPSGYEVIKVECLVADGDSAVPQRFEIDTLLGQSNSAGVQAMCTSSTVSCPAFLLAALASR